MTERDLYADAIDVDISAIGQGFVRPAAQPGLPYPGAPHNRPVEPWHGPGAREYLRRANRPVRAIAVPGYRPPRPGLRGLPEGERSRLQLAWNRYTELKGATQDLLLRFPGALEPVPFETLVRRISALPSSPSSLVRLTGEQLAMLLKASLSVVSRNLGQAFAMAGADDATVARHRAKISRLVETAELVTAGARRIVDTATVAATSSDAVRRAVGLGRLRGRAGLGAFAVDDIAALVAGTIVVLVAIGAVTILVAYIVSAIEAYTAAQEACARDAATGHSCTGADFERYRQEAEEAARRFGLVPNLDDAARRLTGTFEGVIWIAAIAGLGYLAWISWPAASAARARLTARVTG